MSGADIAILMAWIALVRGMSRGQAILWGLLLVVVGFAKRFAA